MKYEDPSILFRCAKPIGFIRRTIAHSSCVIRVPLSWRAYLARKTSSALMFTSLVPPRTVLDDNVSGRSRGASPIVGFWQLFVRLGPRSSSRSLTRSRYTGRCLHSDWTIFSAFLYLSRLRKLPTTHPRDRRSAFRAFPSKARRRALRDLNRVCTGSDPLRRSSSRDWQFVNTCRDSACGFLTIRRNIHEWRGHFGSAVLSAR